MTTAREGGSADHAGAIIGQFDVWASAIKRKNTQGRGASKKIELYGIKKLRELILELAVRGLLVPQDPNDEPACDLLKKIAADKARLVKEGKIKKQKKLPPISDEEKPFELPSNWRWERFGSLAQHNAGKTLDRGRNKGELRDYITTSNLYWGRFDLAQAKQMPFLDSDLEKCLATKFDLLICEGGEAGRAAVWEGDYDVCFQNHIHRARFSSGVNPYFAFRLLQKMDYTGEINNYRKGVAISNMSGKALSSIPFPVPPTSEQHRIVAKVDELMALCDQLEQHTETSLSAHQTLVETLLGALTATHSQNTHPARGAASGGKAEKAGATARTANSTTRAADNARFTDAWQRIAAHFDTLFTTEHSIDQLKQTILQLAVMGKLLPQDPNDEPASELLKKIAAEKQQLIKDKKIKKQKPLPPIGDEETPFELPKGWEWCRLEDVVDIHSGITKGRKLAGREIISVPYLSVANVQRSFLDLKNVKEVDIPVEEKDKYQVLSGDLLITEGGDWDKVGRTAIWRGEMDYVAHQNHVFKARVFLPNQSEAWLERYLNSSFSRDYFAGSSKQTTNLASINKTQLRGCLIAVPPSQEKQHIIKKIDDLMTLCDQLKARLGDAQTTQLHLADAMSEQAIA